METKDLLIQTYLESSHFLFTSNEYLTNSGHNFLYVTKFC